MMVWNSESGLPPGPRLLRTVFGLNEHTQQVSLSRARVIPMSALSLTFAEKMRKMIDVSDVESQFVCWATIENDFERVVDHSMFIVDIHQGLYHDERAKSESAGQSAKSGTLLWEGEFHSPEDTGTAVLAVKPQAALSGVPARVPANVSSPPNMQSSPESVSSAPAVSAPRAKNSTSGMWGVPSLATPRHDEAASLSSEQVSEVMEIALLTSRAAAKIVASVSESQARIDYIIEHTMPLTHHQSLPLQQMTQIVQLLTQMENRLKLIEEQQMLTLDANVRKPVLRSIGVQCSLPTENFAAESFSTSNAVRSTRSETTEKSLSPGALPTKSLAPAFSEGRNKSGDTPSEYFFGEDMMNQSRANRSISSSLASQQWNASPKRSEASKELLADPGSRDLDSRKSFPGEHVQPMVQPSTAFAPEETEGSIRCVTEPPGLASKFRVRKAPSASSIGGPGGSL
jgi:hypothetical protein